MNDDFNSSLAISVLFELAAEVNRAADTVLARQLQKLGAVLGLLQRAPREFLQSIVGSEPGLDAQAIEARIAARREAKRMKHFSEADQIRAELLEAGVILEDKPGGATEWRRV